MFITKWIYSYLYVYFSIDKKIYTLKHISYVNITSLLLPMFMWDNDEKVCWASLKKYLENISEITLAVNFVIYSTLKHVLKKSYIHTIFRQLPVMNQLLISRCQSFMYFFPSEFFNFNERLQTNKCNITVSECIEFLLLRYQPRFNRDTRAAIWRAKLDRKFDLHFHKGRQCRR